MASEYRRLSNSPPLITLDGVSTNRVAFICSASSSADRFQKRSIGTRKFTRCQHERLLAQEKKKEQQRRNSEKLITFMLQPVLFLLTTVDELFEIQNQLTTLERDNDSESVLNFRLQKKQYLFDIKLSLHSSFLKINQNT